ncbi:glycosyltransferase family 4 protein [Corallibacter sp.]|uniref:glycosyltransferase family 4 protein n=1 Tax=Corallibacter sp. TaxID=2038084 RepID=UPI003AB38258
MERKKVAFIISSLTSGGAERVVSTLANSLSEQFDITIITLYKCKPFYSLNDSVNVVSCKNSYSGNASIFLSVKNLFGFIYTILKLLKTHKIDIAIGFMSTTNIYTIISSKLLNIPCIVSERIHPEYSSLNNFWCKVRRFIYPLSNKLVVQTHDIKVYFESFLKPEKITIIRNPLAPELLKKRDSSVKKEKIILNVGRLTNQKNQEALIKAFHKIQPKDWKLQLIGSGKNEKKYKALITELNLQNSVTLLGNINNVFDHYNKASIFAFPSRYEGFPNALTEAMAFGLPCISADCPSGPSELIENNVNGFLIPVDDDNALEDILKLLIENPEKRFDIGEKARKSTSSFEVDYITNEWKKLITSLLPK